MKKTSFTEEQIIAILVCSGLKTWSILRFPEPRRPELTAFPSSSLPKFIR